MTTINDENIPICKCHGVEMLWHKKNDRKSGGTWQCKIQNAFYRRRRESSPQGWVVVRKRFLRKRREEIVNKLKELQNVK